MGAFDQIFRENRNRSRSHAIKLIDKETYGKIPLIFLKVLTFESSFLDKMLNTLPAI